MPLKSQQEQLVRWLIWTVQDPSTCWSCHCSHHAPKTSPVVQLLQTCDNFELFIGLSPTFCTKVTFSVKFKLRKIACTQFKTFRVNVESPRCDCLVVFLVFKWSTLSKSQRSHTLVSSVKNKVHLFFFRRGFDSNFLFLWPSNDWHTLLGKKKRAAHFRELFPSFANYFHFQELLYPSRIDGIREQLSVSGIMFLGK